MPTVPYASAVGATSPAEGSYPRTPYGEADFRRIRLNQWLYVDKTRFIHLEQERYVFLIRPRRFGKSLWVLLLENYYDRRWAAEFEAVFGGTDIGRNPTEDRHRYVVVRFNFSLVNDALETLEREFPGRRPGLSVETPVVVVGERDEDPITTKPPV